MDTQGSAEVDLRIEGMHCEGCVRAVKRALSEVRGVSDVFVDLSTGRATLCKKDGVSLDELITAVDRAGYHANADQVGNAE